jgi:hypothetical protein
MLQILWKMRLNLTDVKSRVFKMDRSNPDVHKVIQKLDRIEKLLIQLIKEAKEQT